MSPAQAAWLKTLVAQARGPLRRASAAPVIGGALLIAQAWLLARVIERAVVNGADLATLAPWLFGIAGLVLVRALITRWGDIAGAHAAEGIKRALRDALFAQQLARPPQWSRQASSGELAASMVDQVDALEGYVARYLPARNAVAILPLAFCAFLMPVDWVVGLLLLITAPLIPLFMALVGWGAQSASQRHMQAIARLSGIFADRLRGLTTLRLYGRAQAEADTVTQASEDLRKRTMSVLRIAFLSSAVLEFFAALGVAGVALYVGLSYLDMIAVPGTKMALQAGLFCLLMAPEVYQPLRQFAAHYHDGEAAKAAVTVIAQTFDDLPDVGVSKAGQLDTAAPSQASTHRAVLRSADAAATSIKHTEPTSHQRANTLNVAGSRGLSVHRAASLEVRGLDIVRLARSALEHAQAGLPQQGASSAPQATHDAQSGHHTELVLQDLRFAIGAGEHVALVGESGAGKSTLIEALAGLGSSPTRILLDGIALADWKNGPLRQRIACLGQRAHLFHGSIADNIRLGRRDATDEDVLTAARLACVTDFADRLPAGLNTQIGTRGHGLSGGERQRVALARIFLRDPGLILLDEPTASLDAETEARVLDAIIDFAQGRTLLVATHSDAVAQRMGRMLKIAGNRVHAVANAEARAEPQHSSLGTQAARMDLPPNDSPDALGTRVGDRRTAALADATNQPHHTHALHPSRTGAAT
nr:ABC transporter ATP-binding protein/permease [Pigmentiphaga aceris]